MKKILMVDDDIDFAGAVKILLESKDYEVVLAHDGKEGLEKARSVNPDLVILDVMMPEMNGYDVCVVLKADPK
ncbi:MAG: response regulator [Desulfobulbaceae bacterium]|nr:response regulator [Desulfobulbaceae bacterium]